MSVTAIVVAGGIGKRMGGTLPKQFLPLGDRPMVFHALKAFDEHPRVDELILVLPAEWIDHFEGELLPRFPLRKLKKIVKGGEARQDSTRQGFLNVVPGTDLVLVHDAARPLIDAETIGRCIDAAQDDGAAIAATPASDTLKEVREGRIVGTVDRGKIFQAQTPQAFRFEVLKEALDRAAENNFQGTDEASLVERLGKPVTIVESPRSNLKVTTPEDFAVALAFLEERKSP